MKIKRLFYAQRQTARAGDLMPIKLWKLFQTRFIGELFSTVVSPFTPTKAQNKNSIKTPLLPSSFVKLVNKQGVA